MNKVIVINNKVTIGGNKRFTLLAGPCAIESEDMCHEVAGKLIEICNQLNINYIFKASFDKANRTSINADRGVGMQKGLQILEDIKNKFDIPVVTDVHESWQCPEVGNVVDIIQIPAFLARQTDLLIAAAKTGKTINVKKAQFMAPWDMKNVIFKIEECGNHNLLLCERGTSFGYNNLVVDMTGLVEMKKFGYPVVFDATHSVQKPGGQGNSTGGNREMVAPLMRAALAVGIDAIFAEVHPNPDKAISDGPNQLRLDSIKEILEKAVEIDNIIKR
jgi:2-dehydro-3-deoxyphosphooctonate aldolase (KDO 8-P synthase)